MRADKQTKQTDRQTYIQTYTLIAILRTPTGDEVKILHARTITVSLLKFQLNTREKYNKVICEDYNLS